MSSAKYTRYLTATVLLLILGSIRAEPEHEHSASNHIPNSDHIKGDHYDADGKHQDSFDHKAILGSDDKEAEFAKMTPEQSKEKLRKMLDIMDMDHNLVITKPELEKWVLHSYTLMDEDGAKRMMKEYDTDKDDMITLKEFNSEQDSNDKDNTIQHQIDNLKFKVADMDSNGKLNITEFAMFLYPYDYENMKNVEASVTMLEMDSDKDGSLSLEEFIGETKGMKKEDIDEYRVSFDKYDSNKDDKLSEEELIPWVMHDSSNTASDEAAHLIEATDSDNNGDLDFEEILDKYEMWVGANNPAKHEEL